MSLPEVLLWQELRKRPHGLKFRRQHAATTHVTDYCHSANLAVEIDGEAHSRGDAPEWDLRRDSELAHHGARVLRIPANEVLDNLEGVVQAIIMEANFTPPPSVGWSPSPEGEDF
jgi:very-short-patch-repair endonuclease